MFIIVYSAKVLLLSELTTYFYGFLFFYLRFTQFYKCITDIIGITHITGITRHISLKE